MTDYENASGSSSTIDNSWVADVSLSSIVEDSGISSLRINDESKDELRWPKLLGVATKPNPIDDWDQLYNLNSQCILRNECRKLAKALDNKRSVPELESFLTLYCKKRNVDFYKDSGWIGILEKVLQFGLPTEHEFNVFFALTTKYVPRDTKQGSQIYDLYRLLLQYHDSELSNRLDSLNYAPFSYASEWFCTLLGSNMDVETCYALWDIYIEKGDPFLMFHLALVFVINARDELLNIKIDNREEALKMLKRLSSQLSAEDVPDFVQLAVHYSDRTPECIRKEFHYLLFGANFDEEAGQIQVSKMLCLPVPAIDLASSDDEISSGKVNFFVIDSRSNQAFDAGHFVSSFNLNCVSFVDEPEKFEIALNSLDAYKASRRPDDHFLFLGYGSEDEDQYMNMVMSQFIQKARPHIAFVHGGFKRLHSYLVETKRMDLLSMHDAAKCSLCTASNHQSSPGQGWHFMSMMKNAMSSTSNKMKEKVEEVVGKSGDRMKESQSLESMRHVDPKERHGKRYRQQSVFTIDDNSDDDEAASMSAAKDESRHEVLNSAEFTEVFDCEEIFRGGSIMAHIALTRTHMHILHDVPEKKGYVTTEARHALSSILAVTSRRSIPELLTFKFGYDLNGTPQISSVHRFLVPKAGECAKAVKTAIFALRPLID